MSRLLLVEDNRDLAQLLIARLAASDFVIDHAGSLADAREFLTQAQYSIAILDLGLPDGDGNSLLRSLRAEGNAMPVLVLTARSSIEDRVEGLTTGADDYLVKPFAYEELLARLQALLRRPSELAGKPIRVGNIVFDSVSKQVTVDDTPLMLSARELAVLEVLITRRGRVVLKGAVEDQLFGLSGEVRSNAVEVYVHRLRKQLADAGATANIHTVRGLGYLIRENKS